MMILRKMVPMSMSISISIFWSFCAFSPPTVFHIDDYFDNDDVVYDDVGEIWRLSLMYTIKG